MNYNMYAVYDRVSRRYGPIQLDLNDDVATRNFAEGIAEIKHKEDLSLMYLGEYNVESGVIQAEVVPLLVADGGNLDV